MGSKFQIFNQQVLVLLNVTMKNQFSIEETICMSLQNWSAVCEKRKVWIQKVNY